MQSNEFDLYFEKFPYLKNHFLGIFSIDNLPQTIPFRKFLICNTDIASGKGIHWFCCVKTCTKFIELFDSLGFDVIKQNLFKTYCKFRTKKIVFNETGFQETTSDTCGKFCIYFIINRMYNLDTIFEDLLEDIFSDSNCSNNEKLVEKFCSEILKNS